MKEGIVPLQISEIVRGERPTTEYWRFFHGASKQLSGFSSAIYDIRNGVVTQHASLAAAVASIGSARCTVVVQHDITMAANATFPSTATLRIENGARITTTGYTLTINGPRELPTSQCFAGSGTVTFGPQPGHILPQWWGATSSSSEADTKTALQTAITAAASQGRDCSVYIGPELDYGYKVEDATTWPSFTGITVPMMVIDHSRGSSYAGYPTGYEGAQERVFMHTPQTTATLTFTGSLSGGATSATLNANWASTTGPWTVTFSNGDVRAVTLTNGATTATWSGGLSSGATSSATYVNEGQHDGNTQWLRGSWAPVCGVSNDAALAAVGNAARRALDNRRAFFATYVDGDATWQFGQGTRVGYDLTDEELSNFMIEKLSASGDTLGGYVPYAVERKTSYISYGGGRNLPRAHHDFEASSGSTGNYLMMLQELSTSGSTRVVWRSPNGSVDTIVQQSNTVFSIAATPGNAVEITSASRRVWTPGSRRYGVTAPTYGTTVSIDSELGSIFNITATNGTAFTISNPTNLESGVRFVLRIINTSGGALGAITWGSAYKLAGGAWTSPATGNSRLVEFVSDGTSCFELCRSSGDVAN